MFSNLSVKNSLLSYYSDIATLRDVANYLELFNVHICYPLIGFVYMWSRSQSHNKSWRGCRNARYPSFFVIRNNVTTNIFRNRQIPLNKFVIILFLKNKVDCQKRN